MSIREKLGLDRSPNNEGDGPSSETPSSTDEELSETDGYRIADLHDDQDLPPDTRHDDTDAPDETDDTDEQPDETDAPDDTDE
ncbi:MAG: hypothetical protein OEV40_25305, partial [Acidimicrobiia bacterium]|nr:hypothetical protein [Acidimicrobiia bacterium]